MKRLAAILAAAVLTAAAGMAQADVGGNAESQRLVSEGMALVTRGKYKEASEKYEQARQASPEPSAPLSAFAHMLFWLARGGSGPQVEKQLQQAELFARKALALDKNDPLANEVLRGLEDTDPPLAAYQPSAEALARFSEGEDLFARGEFDAARIKYREAQRADPKFSRAFVMEGDTYYAQKNWDAAELLFLRGGEMNPLDSQAWRFLADVRAQSGNKPGTLEALYKAIAAKPSDQGNWERVSKVQAAGGSLGKGLAHLHLERKSRLKRDAATGKYTIEMLGFGERAKATDTADRAAWFAYAGALTIEPKDGQPESPFARELRAWNTALAVIADGDVSPDLQRLRSLRQAGQLEAALLLLIYREAYRPELEAWKKANPDGIPKFIDAYHLMP